MYNIIKSVINSGDYELSDMLKKIDTIWVQGDITDSQKEELVTLARDNAKPENTYAPLQEQIDELYAQVKLLRATVEANALGTAALKEAIEGLVGKVENPPQQEDEILDWKQPLNKEDSYMTGNKIKYTDGKVYESTIDYNVWSPEAYPGGWKLIENDIKTETEV